MASLAISSTSLVRQLYALHNSIKVPSLLREILCHISDSRSIPTNRANLANCILVCKEWAETAIPILWNGFASVTELLRLVYIKGEEYGDPEVSFSQSLLCNNSIERNNKYRRQLLFRAKSTDGFIIPVMSRKHICLYFHQNFQMYQIYFCKLWHLLKVVCCSLIFANCVSLVRNCNQVPSYRHFRCLYRLLRPLSNLISMDAIQYILY